MPLHLHLHRQAPGADLNPVAVMRYLLASNSKMFVKYQQRTSAVVANVASVVLTGVGVGAGLCGCAWWCGDCKPDAIILGNAADGGWYCLVIRSCSSSRIL